MDFFKNQISNDDGLLRFGGGIALINAVLLGAEHLFKPRDENFNLCGHKYIPLQFPTPNINKSDHCNDILAHDTNFYQTKNTTGKLYLSELLIPGYSRRINKARERWQTINNNSLEWNEWAKLNPNAARNICLEAEYFYGDGKILPA